MPTASRVMTFSEFGRRPAENASRGTDHGSSAPLFVLGGGIQGGIYGSTPSLSSLDNGNLKVQHDFREVYAALLQNWLGFTAADILPGGPYTPLPLFTPLTTPVPAARAGASPPPGSAPVPAPSSRSTGFTGTNVSGATPAPLPMSR